MNLTLVGILDTELSIIQAVEFGCQELPPLNVRIIFPAYLYLHFEKIEEKKKAS